MYYVDALEPYGRPENIRIHGVAEKINSNKDDEEKLVASIAAKLGIDINECDIQRAHRLGKKNHLEVSRDKLLQALVHVRSETNYCMQKRI